MLRIITCSTVVLLTVVGSGGAQAQVGAARFSRPQVRAYERPKTSPYLNLLNGSNSGNSFEFNYLQRTRPEIDLRRAAGASRQNLARLEGQVNQQVRDLRQSQTSTLDTTGHHTGFMTHHRYFGVGKR